MGRTRFIGVGAVLGLTWAAALRGYMMQLAGPTSTFTFSGTFGIILPAGALVGALLGWAEYQRRTGRRHPLLIGASLLLAILPNLLTAGLDLAPAGLALSAMVGGYAVSGRGTLWVRIVARSRRPRRHRRSVCRAQAVPGSRRHHSVRRLGRHAGIVTIRGVRAGVLHPDAPDRSRPHAHRRRSRLPRKAQQSSLTALLSREVPSIGCLGRGRRTIGHSSLTDP